VFDSINWHGAKGNQPGKPIIALILIAVAVALLVFVAPKLGIKLVDPFAAKQEVRTADSDEARPLAVTQVVSRLLSREDQLPGEIYAYQDVAIYPKEPGFVKWIGVDRGSIVKKGQLMMGIFAPELIAQQNEANAREQAVMSSLHEAEAKLYSAKASYLDAKAKMLGDNDTYTRMADASKVPGVVAPNEVIVLGQTVEADKEKMAAWSENIKAAERQVKSMNESLHAAHKATQSYKDIENYLTIAAPFDGYITERNMHVGSFCGPLGKGAYPPIVRIQQLNLLRITTPVPEIDTSGVEPGAPVQFSVSTHPGERFTGTVARLGNYLEQRTRTMPVELNYWNKKNEILPGMFCEVYWPTRRHHPTLMVPTSAVEQTSTLETFVCKVDKEEKIQWVKVVRGLSMGNMIEVFGDLHDGDVVALQADDSLQVGTKVAPQMVAREKAEAAAPPRPSYHASGAVLTMPDSEREELSKDENKGKEWVH
jgi:RND family efflux transporter MFP subunit